MQSLHQRAPAQLQISQISRIALAVSLALSSAIVAAQTAPPADAKKTAAGKETAKETAKDAAKDEKDGLKLDSIVVTGAAIGAPKMRQSTSVSTLDIDQIVNSGAQSASEILRSIPGVRAESSGGESNANVTVRGVPISAGGARYVQFQEDGLPVLQFGDLQFATPDTFMRLDNSLDRLEVIRGGSASTLATNAPGGIINFISKTGTEGGGSIGISRGVDYDQTRYDFDLGGRLAPKTRYFIGGFYRTGEGVRNGGVNIENGGQLRANITQELDNGFVRLNFKTLDDRTPSFLPVPVRFVNGGIQEIPGIDPRRASFFSPYLRPDITLTRDNGRTSTNLNDGFTAKSTAVGLEAQFDLGSGFRLDEKFRTAKNTGRFIGIFPGDDVRNVTTTFATGPRAGQAYNGPAFTGVAFNTSLDDLNLTANDLKLSKAFVIDKDTKLTATAGLYASLQKVAMTWNFNQYLLEATGDKPALLTSTINGTNAFGGCCSNTTQSEYKLNSPYLFGTFESGPFNLDASVRFDKLKVNGTYNQLIFAPANATTYDQTAARIINYSKDNTSYSLGANYRLTKDVALFARYSQGVAFNGDRITFFSPQSRVDGSNPIPINEVKQTELGVKWRDGPLSAFVTLFQAKTDESNFELTTRRFTANKYDAKGLEFEGAANLGAFRLGAGMTYTNAEVTASNDPTVVGKTPRRQAKFVYQLTPSYSIGDFTLGASVIGTSSAKDDSPAGPISVTLPSYTVINAYVNYTFTQNVSLSLAGNNITDKIGYTETNDGRGAARSINGRAVKLSLKYTF
jgi:outer membrane receptor protein involved in Fe transport